MATTKTTTAKEVNAAPAEERVKIRLFKDNDKYSDDVYVGVDGKGYKIQRGVTVEVPVIVAEILEQSAEQDNQTANLISRYTNEFEAESKMRGM